MTDDAMSVTIYEEFRIANILFVDFHKPARGFEKPGRSVK
jgi:prepilin-type processing-associated H-X9-DG protein